MHFCLRLLSTLAVCTYLHAGAIGLSSLTSTATIINFDDLSGGNCNLCGPSVTSQYSALGAVFNNPSFPTQETVDTNLTSGIPNSSSQSALFVEQGGGQFGVIPFQILFGVPVTMVGF